jgi:DNA-binding NtrC family response regulator
MAGQSILVVDDSESIRFTLRSFLTSAGYVVSESDSCAGALDVCASGRFDAAIVDYLLPDGTALDLLPRLKAAGALLPTIVLTGHGSIDLAVRALQEGAAHFLTKPVDLSTLLVVVNRLVDNQRVLRRERAVKTRHGRRPIDPFLGTSAAIQKLKEDARRVLNSESPVLIHGETGTGKGVLAAWLHENGPRAEESFVDLNCAGLTPQFLETELFGHEKGAFTGAVSSKLGLFELAHRGTLFLDEIGDVDPGVQPKLLKALEEKRFRRLGEVRDRTVDVRLIAASHQDLTHLVREKKLRSDLYFRISALPLEVPSLRQRPEDIPVIARWLLGGIAQDIGRPGLRLASDAESMLQSYMWPGNVRELRNILERAVLLTDSDTLSHVHLRFPEAFDPAEREERAITEIVSLAENERRYLESVVRSVGGRVDEAARALDLPRSSLYEKLKRHNITLPQRGRKPSSSREAT